MLAHARPLPAIAAVVLGLALAGCGGYDPSGPAGGVAVHVDPPHWPDDLPDAVDRLLQGQEAARRALAEGRADEARDDLVPVLRDLARWLPQVAADSDMPEPEWDRVDGISGRMLPIFEAIRRDLDRGRPVPADRLAEADPLLAELRATVDASDPSWFAPPPRADQDPGPEPEGDAAIEGEGGPPGPPEDLPSAGPGEA